MVADVDLRRYFLLALGMLLVLQRYLAVRAFAQVTMRALLVEILHAGDGLGLRRSDASGRLGGLPEVGLRLLQLAVDRDVVVSCCLL